MNKVFKNKKGLTLIELLVTLLLVSIVVVFIYRLILNVNSQTTNPEFAMSNQTIRTEIIRTVEADLVSHDITRLEVVQQDEDNNYNPSIFFIEKDRQSVLSIIDEKQIQYTSFNGQTQRWEVIDCFINFDPSEEGEKSGIVYSQNGVGNSTAAVTVNIVISNDNEHNSGLTEEENNLKDDILISYLAHNNDLQFCTKTSTHTEAECKKYVLIYLDYNYPHKETEGLVTSDQIVGEAVRFPDKPTTEGYTFENWYDSKSGGTKILDNRIIKSEDENMVIYGHWLRNLYRVTFDPNKGTEPQPITFKDVYYDGPYVSDPTKEENRFPTTTRTGYTFKNWRLGTERASRVISESSIVKIAADHTLYAFWEANKYTITLKNVLATQTGTTSLKVTYDSTELDTKIINPKREYTITFKPGTPAATLSKTSIKSTWTFDGWFTAENGGSKVIDSSGKLVANVENYTDSKGNWIRPSAATLYAHWSGGKIIPPTASRTGYNCSLPTIENPPTKDATYTATCIAKTYKITLTNTNATTNSNPTSVTATFDSANLSAGITNPSRVYTITFKPGSPAATLSSTKETSTWTFTGWYTATSGGSKVIGTDGKLVKNVSGYTNANGQWVKDGTATLYAQWSGGTITVPSATRTGYDCSLGAVTNPPTANKEYTATCTAKTYTITLNNQYATTKGSTSVKAIFDKTDLEKINNPSRVYTITFKPGTPAATLSSTKETSTWTFTGWWTAASGGSKVIGTDGKFVASVTGYTDANKKWVKAENATLYAQWSGGTITIPTASRTGYNCSLPTITNPPTANKEYTATCTAKTYTITLDNQLATTKGSTSVTATFDSSNLEKIKNPSRVYTITFKKGDATSISSTKETSTWTFDGWYTKASGGSKVIDSSGKFVANVSGYTNASKQWVKAGNATLYAQWSGGKITVPTATKTGHTCTFGTVTNPPTANKEYTAKCTANKYKVTYNANGCGTSSSTSASLTYGGAYGTLPTFTATAGYTFDGWYSAASGGSQVTATTTISTASDHSIYAHCTNLCTSKTQTCTTAWNQWGACSKTCGTGSQTRTGTKTCKDGYGTGYVCSTSAVSENKNCNTRDCCSDKRISSYGNWGSCSASCGGGTRYRDVYYVSNYDGSSCGSSKESESCNTQTCCTPGDGISRCGSYWEGRPCGTGAHYVSTGGYWTSKKPSCCSTGCKQKDKNGKHLYYVYTFSCEC